MASPKLIYFLVLLVLCLKLHSSVEQRPNIVFIVVDDLGWNDVSWHNPEIIMPTLDKLARTGVILNSSYVQPMCSPLQVRIMAAQHRFADLTSDDILAKRAKVIPKNTINCNLKSARTLRSYLVEKKQDVEFEKYSPERLSETLKLFYLDARTPNGQLYKSTSLENFRSRNSFMSGYYPYHTGLQHFVILAAQGTGLPLNVTLLPQRLKDVGYATHIVGKWHLGFCKWEYTPTYRGFDSFLGYYTSQENYVTHVRDYKSFRGLDFRVDTKANFDDNGTFSQYIFVKRTEEILQSHNKSQPLFLYLPFQSVHAPLQVPKKFEDMYSNIKNITRRKKCGMITAFDEAVGNITRALEENGYMDNTLIIFTTDNGGPVWFGANNLPLRGAKTTLWEGGTKGVGFVNSRTLLKKTGYINTGLMHAVDWFPTILEVAGAPKEPGIDGVSVWSMLSEGATPPRTEFLYNIDEIYQNAALRQGDYKLIQGSAGQYNGWYTEPGQFTERVPLPEELPPLKRNATLYRLFNIRNDPAERFDLATTETNILNQMINRLDEYRKSAQKARYPPDNPNANPANFGGAWSPGWC